MKGKENLKIHFGPFEIEDLEKLIHYLHHLSQETKNRFGPHSFAREELLRLYFDAETFKFFTATDTENDEIIAYTVLKMGWVEYEQARLCSYGLTLGKGDCTIAPSVADNWQSKGVGSSFFHYLLEYLKAQYAIKRIFLWGGVQSTNERAVNFYQKFGFEIIGQFEYHGMNKDMLKILD